MQLRGAQVVWSGFNTDREVLKMSAELSGISLTFSNYRSLFSYTYRQMHNLSVTLTIEKQEEWLICHQS